MKSIAIISLATALLLIPFSAVNCSCAGDTAAIKNVIKDMWDAYNRGDYARALTYCTEYEDEDEEIAKMAAMKNVNGNVTVQSIEDIYISGSNAIAAVTLRIAGQADTDEVKLVKKDGNWKINIKEDNGYAQAELSTVGLAVTSAMLEVSVGELDAGGTIDSSACTMTYKGGNPLPIGDYIDGGIASLIYEYSVDIFGHVNAISGPLADKEE